MDKQTLNVKFEPIKLLFGILGPPKVLGIDIGTTTIKAMELAREGGVVKLKSYGILENYGHLERLNDAIQTSSLKILDDVTAEMVKLLLGEMKPTTRNCAMSLPVFSSFVSLMDMPMLSRKEFANAIPFEARQYVPIPISDVALDWQVLGPAPGQEGRRIQVLLVAVPLDIINKYQRIAELAGLNLRLLEIETISASRAVIGSDPTTTALVDIGARATVISIVDEGYIRMTRSIDVAGGDFTQVIANGFAISPQRAEILKKSKGLLASDGGINLSSLLAPLLGVIASEIQKLSALWTERSKREVGKIVLTGGSAVIPGLREHFAGELQKEVVIGNAFSQVEYPPALEPIVRIIGPIFSVSVGLSLRDLAE